MDVAGFVSAGGAGMLALVVVYLLKANRDDRQQYEGAIDRAEQRADAAEKRTREVRAVNEELRERAYGCEAERLRLQALLDIQRGRDGGS